MSSNCGRIVNGACDGDPGLNTSRRSGTSGGLAAWMGAPMADSFFFVLLPRAGSRLATSGPQVLMIAERGVALLLNRAAVGQR
jgi:hypothetical protein